MNDILELDPELEKIKNMQAHTRDRFDAALRLSDRYLGSQRGAFRMLRWGDDSREIYQKHQAALNYAIELLPEVLRPISRDALKVLEEVSNRIIFFGGDSNNPEIIEHDTKAVECYLNFYENVLIAASNSNEIGQRWPYAAHIVRSIHLYSDTSRGLEIQRRSINLIIDAVAQLEDPQRAINSIFDAIDKIALNRNSSSSKQCEIFAAPDITLFLKGAGLILDRIGELSQESQQYEMQELEQKLGNRIMFSRKVLENVEPHTIFERFEAIKSTVSLTHG